TGASNFVTDGGNFIYDAQLPESFSAAELERRIKGTLGVVDTGLFLGMAERAFVAAPEGVQELTR
ncbi:MAG: ribose-5-phosphate isomerase A, partial [Deinococcus sp.]|nr:ribose-5-phosphate isomerase A [Deinococcus sp.]